MEDDPDIKNRKNELKKQVNELFKKQKSKVNEVNGVWRHGAKGSKYERSYRLSTIILQCQIHKLIQLKYNFIHYNPLPSIKSSDTEGLDQDSDEDDLSTEDIPNKQSNLAIKLSLLKEMKYNIKEYDVESPFYRKTIIIDEVHNFVRETLNDSGTHIL